MLNMRHLFLLFLAFIALGCTSCNDDDNAIMEEILHIIKLNKNFVGTQAAICAHLSTLIHWIYWFRANIAHETSAIKNYGNLRNNNDCQALKIFIESALIHHEHHAVMTNRDKWMHEFLNKMLQIINVENGRATTYGELIDGFIRENHFQLEIVEQIVALNKEQHEKAKRRSTNKHGGNTQYEIDLLYNQESTKAVGIVEPIKERLSSIVANFSRTLDFKRKMADFKEEIAFYKNRLLNLAREKGVNVIGLEETIADLLSMGEEDVQIPAKLQSLNQQLRDLHTEIGIDFLLFYRADRENLGLQTHRYAYVDSLKDKTQTLATFFEQQMNFEESRKEFKMAISQFQDKFSDQPFYPECASLQTAIKSFMKKANEFELQLASEMDKDVAKKANEFALELATASEMDKQSFKNAVEKFWTKLHSMESAIQRAIGETFMMYNIPFFQAAQKYLRTTILKAHFTIKTDPTAALKTLQQYAAEKHQLWREMYANTGFCRAEQFEHAEKKFIEEIKKIVGGEEFQQNIEPLLISTIRQQFYQKLGLNETTPNEIKIRFSGPNNLHAHVCVGNYEYDYSSIKPPSRTLFRHNIDDNTQETDPKKSKPMRNSMTFTSEQSDAVFFQMCKNGWNKNVYNLSTGRQCISFAYELVCALHNDGECPPKEQWPENFVSVADNMPHTGSVFEQKYQTRWHQHFRNEYTKPKDNDGCTIEDFRFEFEIDNVFTIEGLYFKFEIDKVLEKILPPTIYYKTSKYSKRNLLVAERREKDEIEIQEFVHKKAETDHKIVYETVLKAYACNVDFKLHARIHDFKLLKKGDGPHGVPLFDTTNFDLYDQAQSSIHSFKLDADTLEGYWLLQGGGGHQN